MIRPKLLVWLGLSATLQLSAQVPSKLELKNGDHIAIIGNTLADRQQHHAWLESLITKAHPDLDLTIRNLGFAADELTVRPRSKDVPETKAWLTKVKADVIFAYYGFNESFKGQEGLDKFKKDLEKFIKDTLATNFNGKNPPRLVIFSPLAHENLEDPNYPDGEANNQNLALYTAAMEEVAKAQSVMFVDLFKASQAAYAANKTPLTHNGIHLTEFGDKTLAPAQFQALFTTNAPAEEGLDKLRTAILDKNNQWHHIYRSVDQFNIYGDRGHIPYKDVNDPNFKGVTNNTTMLMEMAQRDVLTANRDQHVWAMAKGQDHKIDDSNLPPVEAVPANKKDVAPYLNAEEAIKRMKVAKGCKVELVASEEQFPALVKPVQMAWDTKGRLWVAAWPNYPETTPTTRDFDKLLVIDIDPKTGKAAKVTPFLDNLNCPTGFQFYKDGVLLIQSPDLWYVRDTDGDGKGDWKERVLNGLDAADSHHETNSMCLEPGGATYCSDGVFHRTNIETPTGPVRNVDGAIYRFEPNTNKFERYMAYGFANPHGRIFDYWGNDLITDATGNNTYFGPGVTGFLNEPNSHSNYPQFWNRPSRPCAGTNILSSRHFPAEFQGNFLNCNVISFQGIYRAKVTPDGSALKGETIEDHLVSSDDPNFRPSAVSVAPDGSIYFCDWSNTIIGHLQHHLRDPNRDHSHGRIYRITHEGSPLLPIAKVDGEPIANLLELLKTPENDVRMRAKIELSKHETKEVIAATQNWAKQFDPKKAEDAHHLMEALWVHQWHNIVNPELIQTLLKSPEPNARAQAVRVICYQRDRLPDALAWLLAAAGDEAPRVRLEAVRAASFFSGADAPKAYDVAYATLKRESDPTLDYCRKETLRQLGMVSREKSLPSDPEVLAMLIGKMDDKELKNQPKTESVLLALLERKSYDLPTREEAVKELVKLRKTDRLTELLSALAVMDAKGDKARAAAVELGKLLSTTPAADLTKGKAGLTALAGKAQTFPVRQAAWAGLVMSDANPDSSWTASDKPEAREALIQALSLVTDPVLRAKFQGKLVELLNSGQATPGQQQAILRALPLMGADHAKANFAILATHFQTGKDRNLTAEGLMQLPKTSWDKTMAATIAQTVLDHAKTVPANKRSEQDYVELSQLGMEMATLADNAALRKELRGLSVNTFVVKAVREQLRYDTQRIVVQTGKPFEVVFENPDAMPHNFVVVPPGQHMAIGTAAITMTPDVKDKQGRAYLPKDQKIFAATKLLEAGEKEKLQINAPGQEGEYEFVCTYPGHFMIMWGQLVVTKDVDAYLSAHPTVNLPNALAPAPTTTK